MKSALGLLLGFLATASWGIFYIIGRWLFGEEWDKLNPYLFNLLRFGMAVCAFMPLLFFAKNRALVKRAFTVDLKKFLLIALIGIVMENFLVFYALNFTTSARCSLMANCSPIATVILAYFLLRQKSSFMGIIGMLVGFAGIILAGVAQGGDVYAATGMRSLIGDGMALASGFCWAFFTVFGAKCLNAHLRCLILNKEITILSSRKRCVAYRTEQNCVRKSAGQLIFYAPLIKQFRIIRAADL